MGGCPVALYIHYGTKLRPALFARHLNQRIQAAIVPDRHMDDWLSIGP